MTAAVFVDDPGRKVEEGLSALEILRHQKLHGIRKLPSYYLQKCLIVVSRKGDICIVIPRDKALVADRTK